MKVLLIGKSGQLGNDLILNNPGHEIIAPDRTVLDITSCDVLSSLIRELRPDAVINTAAFHNVPLCESEVEQAFRVNCAAVRDLALACRAVCARLITFSSDYVFGGDKRSPYLEDDRPQPLQIYGISRVAGEFAAQSVYPEGVTIVRTCGLYGRSGAVSKGGNFVDKRLADARVARQIEMGCDQIVSPTSTADLSLAVWRLAAHPGGGGLYHLVNQGECSWYKFTVAIYQLAGVEMEVLPVDRGGLSGSMRRPLYSVLANTRAKELGIELPHWRDALARYLQGN